MAICLGLVRASAAPSPMRRTGSEENVRTEGYPLGHPAPLRHRQAFGCGGTEPVPAAFRPSRQGLIPRRKACLSPWG
ncbi:hypothetical protein ACFPTY_16215 [Halomonas beimenensis]|uniref:hypothetical protein n=1 Tax=Halomonas beimenensis TaxID=475662 RepID=UPI00360B9E90